MLQRRLVILFLVVYVSCGFSISLAENIIYSHPLPNSQYISIQTDIIIRLSNDLPRDHLQFIVRGNESGPHPGKTILSTDERTIIFHPDAVFAENESVTVTLIHPDFALPSRKISYCFQTSGESSSNLYAEQDSHQLPIHKNNQASQAREIRQYNGVSVPSDFPEIRITVDEEPAEGKIFTSVWGTFPYLIILDRQGNPVYYKQLKERSYDFKPQPTGVLTYYVREDLNAYIVMDSTYTIVDTLRCRNYNTDEHELRILPNAHVVMLAAEAVSMDMSKYVENGNPNARLRGNHIQEFDETGNLIFEWRCWDYFKPTDAEHLDLTAATIDFTHSNALDIDVDGNYLLSSRSLSEITKIDRNTGQVMWRLGGVNNQFDLINDDDGFSYQHSIRALGDNNYVMFDNGNYRDPQFSRAVEFHLDTNDMTATCVWQYRHTPDYFAQFLGNVQRLNNGNTLINWASQKHPKLLEVRPDGTKAFELDFSAKDAAYRTFRKNWQGCARVPSLIAESHSDCVALIFNKFGDKNVHHYNIYADTTEHPTRLLSVSPKPYLLLTSLQNYTRYFFRVTAVSKDNVESDFSNEVCVDVCYAVPFSNVVLNGGFDRGMEFWELEATDADIFITSDHECQIVINNAGSDIEDIKLVQNTIDLVEGGEYKLTFTARADVDRLMEVALKQDVESWTDYAEIGLVLVKRRAQDFSYTLTMTEPSDYRAILSFCCGSNDASLYLSNICLCRIDTTNVIETKLPELSFLLFNYPNPFNSSTSIYFETPESGSASLKIYDIQGRMVYDAEMQDLAAGQFYWIWNGVDENDNQVAAGVYLYRVEFESQSGQKQVMMKKMSLVK